MASNAWERAQEAIARAAERDSAVITPDTAASPFDSSATTFIPRTQAARRSPPTDPDVTQRLSPRTDGAVNGHGGQNGHRTTGRHAAPAGDDDQEPEALTDRLDPRPTVRTSHPGTSPFPASRAPEHDETPAAEEPPRPWWRRWLRR